ncbi:MAG: matrixin family metalloprotease, partial [Candidatus Aenigmatarchaeota archaeon]
SHTSANLVGSYSIDNGATWDDETPDGRNEMVFGDYPQSGVIAVTIIWGYFYGPPGQREIIEFDILFDTDFTWGDATKDPSVMDLQNIATHEIGHGFGLGDLYDSACAEETMYGYSTEGETKKRDLNAGDITGIQELYGA